MPQLFRSASQLGNTGASFVISAPAGVLNGDILVFAILGNSTATTATLAGWTQLYTQSMGTGRLQVFWKQAASEPASYTWAAGSALNCGAMVALSGALGTVDQSSIKVNGSTTILTGTAITPAEAGELLVWIGARLAVATASEVVKPTNGTVRANALYAGATNLAHSLAVSTHALAGGTTVAADHDGSLSGVAAVNAVAVVVFKTTPEIVNALLFCEA